MALLHTQRTCVWLNVAIFEVVPVAIQHMDSQVHRESHKRMSCRRISIIHLPDWVARKKGSSSSVLSQLTSAYGIDTTAYDRMQDHVLAIMSLNVRWNYLKHTAHTLAYVTYWYRRHWGGTRNHWCNLYWWRRQKGGWDPGMVWIMVMYMYSHRCNGGLTSWNRYWYDVIIQRVYCS